MLMAVSAFLFLLFSRSCLSPSLLDPRSYWKHHSHSSPTYSFIHRPSSSQGENQEKGVTRRCLRNCCRRLRARRTRRLPLLPSPLWIAYMRSLSLLLSCLSGLSFMFLIFTFCSNFISTAGKLALDSG